MENREKTKEQLVKELGKLRKRIAELEKEEAKRKSVRNAPGEFRESFVALFNNFIDLVFLHDLKGKFIDANPAALKLLGYKREEITSLSISSLLSKDQMPKALATIEEIKKTGNQKQLTEYKLERKNGEHVYAETQSGMIYRDGKPYAILGVARDITERKEFEEKEKQHIHDLLTLSETAMGLVELSPKEDIYKYITKQLKKLVKDSVVYTSSFDEASQKFRLHAVLGMGNKIEAVVKLLGRHPVGITSPISEEAWLGLTSGKLEKVPGGLYDLSAGSIPKTVCDSIEKLINYGKAYAMGFSWKGKLFGSSVIIIRKGAGLRNPRIIETFIRLASVALQRRQAEEALLRAKKELEIRVKERTAELARANEELMLEIAQRIKSDEKIKASLKEKEVMLKEIHHRIKNNMQIISSLLRLQSAKIKDKKIQEIFRVSQNRLKSMALIHESLYKSEDLARIDFSAYIRTLVTRLFSLYRTRLGAVTYKLETKDVVLEINRAIPCGLIINELVSNALKHAFPNGRKGEINLKMYINKSGEYTLVVKDTGIGLPKTFDFRKTQTLGMNLVLDLVKQIKGKIKLKRNKGTEFRIVF